MSKSILFHRGLPAEVLDSTKSINRLNSVNINLLLIHIWFMFYRHQIILHTNIEKTAFNSLLASLLIIIVNNLDPDPDLIQQLMKGLILIQTVCQPDGILKILVLKKNILSLSKEYSRH